MRVEASQYTGVSIAAAPLPEADQVHLHFLNDAGAIAAFYPADLRLDPREQSGEHVGPIEWVGALTTK